MILPTVGKYYWHYDDGKITPSRQEIVQIIKIVKYSELSKELQNKIDREKRRYDWLYDNTNNDCYVLFGRNLNMIGFPYIKGDESVIYLLDINKKGWFGFGENCFSNSGRLDVDGSRTQQIINNFQLKDHPLFPTRKTVSNFIKQRIAYMAKKS